MKKPTSKRDASKSNLKVAIICGVSVVVVGVALFATSAAGAFINLELNNATGTASVVDDPLAAGGKALQFGAPSPSQGSPDPQPSSPVPTDPGSRIFTESFESGNLDQWGYQACPEGVTLVTEPVRAGSHSAKFTVSDGDTKSKCDDVPTDDPRAQLVSDSLFGEGDEYYIGFSTLFPADFPTPESWFQISEIYGPPFGGSPSMGVDMDGDRIAFSRDETHGYDSPWKSAPIERGKWNDIVLHIKFSPDASVGFVEIWHNGVQQTFEDGSKRLHYATLARGINWEPGGRNSLFMNQYRDGGSNLGTVTYYHDEVYVGKTYESVAR